MQRHNAGEALSSCRWDVSPSQGYPQHYVLWYPFIHLSGKRHCENEVSCTRTQRNVHGQGRSRITRVKDERTNRAPNTFASKYRIIKLQSLEILASFYAYPLCIVVKFAFENVDFLAEEPLRKGENQTDWTVIKCWPHCWEAMLTPLRHPRSRNVISDNRY